MTVLIHGFTDTSGMTRGSLSMERSMKRDGAQSAGAVAIGHAV